jgi:chorismate mutase
MKLTLLLLLCCNYFLKLNKNPLVNFKLKYYRFKIDRTDDKIYNLLNNRFTYAKKLSKYKTKIIDPQRENYILERLNNKNLLDNKFIKDIWTIIFKKSCKIQEDDINFVINSFNKTNNQFKKN